MFILYLSMVVVLVLYLFTTQDTVSSVTKLSQVKAGPAVPKSTEITPDETPTVSPSVTPVSTLSHNRAPRGRIPISEYQIAPHIYVPVISKPHIVHYYYILKEEEDTSRYILVSAANDLINVLSLEWDELESASLQVTGSDTGTVTTVTGNEIDVTTVPLSGTICPERAKFAIVDDNIVVDHCGLPPRVVYPTDVDTVFEFDVGSTRIISYINLSDIASATLSDVQKK